MAPLLPLLPRLIEGSIERTLEAVPVVVVEGGRATGKTTTCDRLIERHAWAPRVDLSDPNVLATLRLDPERFLAWLPAPCVVDEAQLEPTLTVWVKRLVDQRGGPGQFLLTGSARLGRDQLGGSDPLAGRSVRLRMWSMTRRELKGLPSDFVARAFGDGWGFGPQPAAPARRSTWLGGLPGISGVRSDGPAAQWEREIAGYVESVLRLGAGGSRADLGRLLRTFRYLAANSGQLLNVSRTAGELGMQANTVRSHLEMLEAAFLVFRVEAHRPSEHRVVTAHPRVFAADVGLATWAARAWDESRSAALTGSLTESLVAHDLAAAVDAHPERVVLRHWRDERNKKEVDLLLVHPDDRLVPVEVKASTTVGPGDAAGLRAFADRVGEACVRGVLLYEGASVIDLSPPGERGTIVAVPRSLL